MCKLIHLRNLKIENFRQISLEELEDKDSCETSIVLNEDGSVSLGATSGPIPMSARGEWSMEEKNFEMEITREFESIEPFEVTRKFSGEIEEILKETKTIILSGDILMDETPVGFFKMISNLSDIEDGVKNAEKNTFPLKPV
uniref:Uncharacterized protein n=1 Tax=Vaucheria litorea TaxID=109269 RepID=H6WBB0_VAULI|nr:hypothetical protein [Vaucheria litorea]